MKSIKATEYNKSTNESIYFTDIGTYAVKRSHGYNTFEYFIRKLDGTWPEDKEELGNLIHHYYSIFGGSVTVGEETAYVLGWGAD
jgi:hypothetical protein